MDPNLNDEAQFKMDHIDLLENVSSSRSLDPESLSTCPLLTPSPTEPEFRDSNPLSQALEQNQMLLEGKSPSPDFNNDEETALLASSPIPAYVHPLDPLKSLSFERRGTSSSSDMKISAGLANHYNNIPQVLYCELEDDVSKHSAENALQNFGHRGRRSFSNDLLKDPEASSNIRSQENASSAKLLPTDYELSQGNRLNETEKFIGQDDGKNQPQDPIGCKLPPEYAFTSWNWPLIRKSCFWTIISSMVACFCVLVGMLAVIPRRCYPLHGWYQGTVFYEIFPGSYQDSNGDGVGDLRGIAYRVDYLSKIGIRAIRLNSIFPANHYPEGFDKITNLTSIEPSLGNLSDFWYLVKVFKNKNISVILDLPMYPYVKNLGELKVSVTRKKILDKINNVVRNHRSHRSVKNESYLPHDLLKKEFTSGKSYLKPYIDGGISGLMKLTSDHINSISQSIVEEAIEFWFQNGASGIYLKGLEHYVSDPKFLFEMKKWKSIKDSFQDKGENKILMCDGKVLNVIDDEETFAATMETMDLLDVYLDVSNGTSHIKEEVNKHQRSRIFDKSNYPWIHWNIGNVQTKRLAGKVENNLGAILFQYLLPGTISIFYGDEIGLTEIHDPHSDHKDVVQVHHLAPMKWQPNGTGFTRHNVLPWLPFAKSTRTNDIHEEILANMTALRNDSPSIYMNSIWKDQESLSNWAFRFIDENIIVMERSYPRRNAYVVVYNAGADEATNDLSNIYYRGELMEDSRGKTGSFVQFNRLKLGSGEAFVVKLDK